MRKTNRKRRMLKKDSIKYLPKKKDSRVALDRLESTSQRNYDLASDLMKLRAPQPIVLSPVKAGHRTRNEKEKFDGSKRIILIHENESSNN
mmetsp:Transcript_37986/g.43626  ORF Transcript_37986/g.43626 Transcript_37986/m.43626 type:complete len:91 (+) Transcript_37986:271-543(+)